MNRHYPTERPVFGRRHATTPQRRLAADERLRTLREAAAKPEVDGAKFRELLQLEERQASLEARKDFDRAFSQMQQEFPVIAERGVLPFTNQGRGSTYALWEDINETIKPYLTRHNFALRFRTAQDPSSVSVTCYLGHMGGHSEETTVRLPLDLSDGKSGVHAVGSSTSYAKRYAASALLNITSAGEDDDGHAAGKPPNIDPEQLGELRLLLAQVEGDEGKLASLLGVETLSELPVSCFRQAVSLLKAKGIPQMNQLIQGSPEWFTARLGIVTASRIADVVARTKSGYGASRANYMAQLVAERLTRTPTEGFVSPAMQWGLDHEANARATYEFYSDNSVEVVGFVAHPTIPMSGASPDGFVGADGLIELKCPNTSTHIDTLLEGGIPAKYENQMLWQMACTGREWCDLVSYDPRMPDGMSLYIQRLARNEAKIAALEVEVAAFIDDLNDVCGRLVNRYSLEAAA